MLSIDNRGLASQAQACPDEAISPCKVDGRTCTGGFFESETRFLEAYNQVLKAIFDCSTLQKADHAIDGIPALRSVGDEKSESKPSRELSVEPPRVRKDETSLICLVMNDSRRERVC
jgi:hypothetical protein